MGKFFSFRTHGVTLTLLLLAMALAFGAVYLHNRLVANEYINEIFAKQVLQQAQLAVSDDDRVYGSRTAPTRLVFYSDVSCQYCRQLFPTLLSIVDESNGAVALVYRHIPIRYLRGTIGADEIASECVQRELGDEGFFKFIENLYMQLGPKGTVDPVPETVIFQSAEVVGVSRAVIDDCIQQRYAFAHIESQHVRGELLGVGTIPHTFVVNDTNNLSLIGNRPASLFSATISSLESGAVGE